MTVKEAVVGVCIWHFVCFLFSSSRLEQYVNTTYVYSRQNMQAEKQEGLSTPVSFERTDERLSVGIALKGH